MIDSIRHHLSVAAAYARFSVQRQMEYPFSYVGVVCSLTFFYIWVGVTFKLLVDNFQPLSGWTFPQLTFLYGLSLISRGIMSIISFQSREIDELVTRGEFDRLLVRPMNVTFQFAVNHINLVGFVHFSVGIGYFIYGANIVDFAWSVASTISLFLVVLGGTLIYWSFFALISCVAFWTMRSAPLVDASHELLTRGTFYPLTIYPQLLQLFLTFVMPVGFIAFYPSCDFLGQPDRSALPLDIALLTPVVGIVMFIAALALFNSGLRRYESAGS